ncbi:MAG: MerR family transcriptional regulator [Raoultibacter sp.]
MEDNLSIDFSVGEMARYLGMSPQGLHWYESKGLVSPDRDKTYRRYSRDSLFLLSRARFYHQAGFSIEEIDDLLNMELPSIADSMERHVALMRRQVAIYQARLDIIEERTELIKNFQINSGALDVVELEPFYFRCNFEHVANQEKIKRRYSCKEWVQDIPLSQYLSLTHYDDSGDITSKSVGLSLPERFRDYACLQVKNDIDEKEVLYFPPTKALYGLFEWRLGDDLFSHEQRRQFAQRGDLANTIMMRPITCHRSEVGAEAYWEVWIPLV